MLYGTHYLFCDKPNGNYMNYRYVYRGCVKKNDKLELLFDVIHFDEDTWLPINTIKTTTAYVNLNDFNSLIKMNIIVPKAPLTVNIKNNILHYKNDIFNIKLLCSNKKIPEEIEIIISKMLGYIRNDIYRVSVS